MTTRWLWCGLLLTGTTVCQEWVQLRAPLQQVWFGSYDSRRDRLVRPANGLVWEFSRDAWLPIATGQPPFAAPVERLDYALTFAREWGKTYLFGGQLVSGSMIGDMWSWDGLGWQQISSGVQPQRRTRAGMAFDPSRHRLILVGGVDGTTVFNDTWEYDGSIWTTGTPLSSSNSELVAAYHPGLGGVMVVRGGTFLYQRGSWTTLAGSVAVTSASRLSYDEARQVMVLFNVAQGAQVLEWNSTGWVTQFQGPAPTFSATMFFDRLRGATVLADRGTSGQLWAWDGTSMTQLSGGASTQPAASANSVWFDDSLRSNSILLTSIGETWNWDGHDWTRLLPPTSPAGRTGAAATFDSQHGVGLIFGGNSFGVGHQQQLWQWDGANWSQLSSTGPPPRSFAAMTYDLNRGRAIVFGGAGNGGLLNDLWEWDGATWTQRSSPLLPPATLSPGMAYDPVLGRTVMVAGLTVQPQTWTWDGQQWTLLSAQMPTIGAYRLAFDPGRGHVVALVGGSTPTAIELIGSNWVPLSTSAPANVAALPLLIHNSRRQRLQVFDGSAMWELAQVAPRVIVHGSGCGQPAAQLMAHAQPTLGESAFGFDAAMEPAALVFLGLSSSQANTPLGNGCTLQIGPLFALLSANADVTGLARMPIPLPPVAALAGLTVWAQAGALSATTPGGLLLSQGLELLLGF